jgi:L-amino acid N-acyltransferase YncA
MITREALAADAEQLAAIYNHYIEHTIVTFEEVPVSARDMADRLAEIHSASYPWLVAEDAGHVVGFAYGAPWKNRVGYRFSSEITVYLADGMARRGLGSRLYGVLLPELRSRGIHTVLGGIALPNEGSVALHEKFGMRKVAHLSDIGYKFGTWIDVGYWQRSWNAIED